VTAGSAPERWLRLEVERPRDDSAAALVIEELLALDARGLEERDGWLILHLPDPAEGSESMVQRLRDSLRLLPGVPTLPEIRVGWQEHEEWAELWKQGFQPRRISPRILVHPSWVAVDPEPGCVGLVLDPGMAFGTAEHPTTRGSLRLLDEALGPGDRVADIGAGSGILAIAAALLGAREVVAIELEPWSCEAARENAHRNGVQDRVEVREGVVTEDFLPGDPPFEGILANIETGFLLPLLSGFRRGLQPGGWLILSGILEEEFDYLAEAALAAGFRLRKADREGGWCSALFGGPEGD